MTLITNCKCFGESGNHSFLLTVSITVTNKNSLSVSGRIWLTALLFNHLFNQYFNTYLFLFIYILFHKVLSKDLEADLHRNAIS